MFFDGQLVGWRSVAIPGYGMPYQDMLVLHCAALGMGTNRIAAIVLDEELYPASFISKEINLSIAEMRRREAGDEIDVLISPFLERYGEFAPLFHVINHPGRPALAYVANAILTRLGYAADCAVYRSRVFAISARSVAILRSSFSSCSRRRLVGVGNRGRRKVSSPDRNAHASGVLRARGLPTEILPSRGIIGTPPGRARQAVLRASR